MFGFSVRTKNLLGGGTRQTAPSSLTSMNHTPRNHESAATKTDWPNDFLRPMDCDELGQIARKEWKSSVIRSIPGSVCHNSQHHAYTGSPSSLQLHFLPFHWRSGVVPAWELFSHVTRRWCREMESSWTGLKAIAVEHGQLQVRKGHEGSETWVRRSEARVRLSLRLRV